MRIVISEYFTLLYLTYAKSLQLFNSSHFKPSLLETRFFFSNLSIFLIFKFLYLQKAFFTWSFVLLFFRVLEIRLHWFPMMCYMLKILSISSSVKSYLLVFKKFFHLSWHIFAVRFGSRSETTLHFYPFVAMVFRRTSSSALVHRL